MLRTAGASGSSLVATDPTSLGLFPGRVQHSWTRSRLRVCVPWRCALFSPAVAPFPPTATHSTGAGGAERTLRKHATGRDRDDAAAQLGGTCDGGEHVVVGDTEHDEVVRVVRDRRRERAAPQAGAAHEPDADAARREVPLDDGDLG